MSNTLVPTQPRPITISLIGDTIPERFYMGHIVVTCDDGNEHTFDVGQSMTSYQSGDEYISSVGLRDLVAVVGEPLQFTICAGWGGNPRAGETVVCAAVTTIHIPWGIR